MEKSPKFSQNIESKKSFLVHWSNIIAPRIEKMFFFSSNLVVESHLKFSTYFLDRSWHENLSSSREENAENWFSIFDLKAKTWKSKDTDFLSKVVKTYLKTRKLRKSRALKTK
jgi:hypothetical protein